MSAGLDIVVVEDSPSDNGFNWVSGGLHFGELNVVSVEDMVTKVLVKAGGMKIASLTIIGHASPGDQSVGAGLAFDMSGKKALAIDPATNQLRGDAEKYLFRLKGNFAQDAVITLGGCNVAKGEQGKALLKRISKLLGNIYVQGSEDTQRPLPGMEGIVIRCRGDVCWVQTRNWLSDGSVKKIKK